MTLLRRALCPRPTGSIKLMRRTRTLLSRSIIAESAAKLMRDSCAPIPANHRSESCWIKFPNLAPQAAPNSAPVAKDKERRENTPAPAPTIQKRGGRSRRRSSGRKSDRGSSYERSASEPESPRDRGTRKRHRSNRILVNKPESTSTGMGTSSSLFGPSGQLG